MPLPHFSTDVLVVGSGFAGSLTALLLHKIGLQVMLVDARSHPRFAIGESSTPVSNLILESLGRQYGLDWLIPLANYSSWKSQAPELGVGLKRGFSYFHHQPGIPFRPDPLHANELLVSASHGPDDADTHWVRADFDHHFFQQAQSAGIPCFEQTRLGPLHQNNPGWQVTGYSSEHLTLAEPAENGPALWNCTAKFIIDATGDGGYLTKQLGLPDESASLHTWSRALFAHFTDVEPWETIYRAAGGSTADYPFPADDAALHHVFEQGWMWNLRFDHGVTSAGFCLTTPIDPALSPQQEWDQLLARYPSIGEQYRNARIIAPGKSLIRTGRLQRCIGQAAGPGWALLPYAAGFIDPLHSTGNAQTLVGIERLIRAFEIHWNKPAFENQLAEYDRLVRLEIHHMDRIVAGCYRGFDDFPRMVAMSMFYFATSIWLEVRRREGRDVPRSFLCADEKDLQQAVERSFQLIADQKAPTDEVVTQVLAAIEPFNLARLGDPECRNLYPYI